MKRENVEFTKNLPPDKGDRGGYVFYDKRLTSLARKNRRNATAPEKKFWYEVLSNRSIVSYKFLRQKPLDQFIVDFYCAELRLAIELDGDSHGEQKEYDEKRTELLKKRGIEMARYTNIDIMANMERVYEDLSKKITARKKFLSPAE